MPPRRRPLGLAPLIAISLVCAALPAGPAVAAEGEAGAPLSVELAPLGPDGIGGLALLAAAEGGTSVQLLVVGAPAGTSAVIHAGDCAAIDPAPLGLLGDVSAGQLGVTLPIPLASLADGAHVIVLHPGLDLVAALGCGVIPAAAVPDLASAAPQPVASAAPAPAATAAPTLPSVPPPTTDPACVGVVAWVQATNTRLDELDALAQEANQIAGGFDLPAYIGALQAFAGAVQAAMVDQEAQPVPGEASAANVQALAAYGRLFDAASLFHRYYTIDMSFDTYALATSTYEEALGMVAEMRRETGRLIGSCEGP